MNTRRSLSLMGPILVLALILIGCGKRHKDTEPVETGGNPLKPDPAGGPPAASHELRSLQLQVLRNIMEQLGLYYVAYQTERGKPPHTREEFRAYLQEDPGAGFLAQALDKDWLVLRLDPPPNTNQVLGYEKEPFKLRNDRLVLLGGGAVQGMGDAEFQEALKR